METMKALRLNTFGGIEHLEYGDIPRPHPQAGEALVRVYAAALTPSEFTWIGESSAYPMVMGHEFSGVVAEVGADTTGVNVGDEVYGLPAFDRDGAQAEYVVVKPSEIAPKPRRIDHTQAAEVPISALTAWQALFDHAQVAAGQRVVVLGASGAVGAYAVQLARRKGAEVIAVAAARHADLVRELGATQVVDYTTPGYEDAIRDVDVVFDTFGGEALERAWPMVKPGGALISIVDRPSNERAEALGIRAILFVVEPNRSQLVEIGQIIDAGALRPLTDATYPLAQSIEAYTRAAQGHLLGKIILRVAE